MLTVTVLASLATASKLDVVKLNHRAERLKVIDAHNARTDVTWKAGINSRFEHEPIGASKTLCGVKGNWSEDVATALANGDFEEFVPTWSANAPIPDSFDAATNFATCAKIINDIRDQSNCGCCWAFGGAEAASDRMCIASQGKLMFPLSAQDVCFCSNPDGCGGGQITTPWMFIKNKGAVSGGQYKGSGPFGTGMCQDFTLPHCHHHGPQGKDPYPAEGQPGCESQQSPRCSKTCDSSATGSFDKYTYTGRMQTASGVKAIQQMIMEGGPVETAFTVYSDFENYVGGVYKHTSGQMMGGHAVKFVGWGVDPQAGPYWKVANSWNPYWGEDGFFRIAHGEGGIDDQVTGSSADSTWKKKTPWEN